MIQDLTFVIPAIIHVRGVLIVQLVLVRHVLATLTGYQIRLDNFSNVFVLMVIMMMDRACSVLLVISVVRLVPKEVVIHARVVMHY